LQPVESSDGQLLELAVFAQSPQDLAFDVVRQLLRAWGRLVGDSSRPSLGGRLHTSAPPPPGVGGGLRLVGREAEDVVESLRAGVSPRYRRQVEAYFRELSQRRLEPTP